MDPLYDIWSRDTKILIATFFSFEIFFGQIGFLDVCSHSTIKDEYLTFFELLEESIGHSLHLEEFYINLHRINILFGIKRFI